MTAQEAKEVTQSPDSGSGMTQELLRLRGVSPMSPEEALALTRRALDAFGLSEWRVRLTDFPAQQETKVENGITHTRPRRRLGLCRYQAKTIEVSRSHVEQDRRDFVTETIAEEVAHALTEGDTNHGLRWKTAYQNIRAILLADAEERHVIERLVSEAHRGSSLHRFSDAFASKCKL